MCCRTETLTAIFDVHVAFRDPGIVPMFGGMFNALLGFGDCFLEIVSPTDEGYEQDLTIAARRHDLVALSVADRTEHEIPLVPALVRFTDPETGEDIEVDGWSLRMRRFYENEAAGERMTRRDAFRRRGLDLVEMRTDRDYVNPLLSYFKERGKRR